MKFFGTFMQKQAFKNHYVEIEAPSELDARAAMHSHFGREWFTTYKDAGFSNQAAEFGLKRLVGIRVIMHDTGAEYKILEEQK